MLRQIGTLAAAACLVAHSYAAPTAIELEEKRGLISDLLGASDPYSSILASLTAVKPTATPANVAAASVALSSVMGASSPAATSNIYPTLDNLAAAGLSSSTPAELLSFVNGVLTGANSMNNVNFKNPRPAVYPKAGSSDAPYDLTQAQLRAAIHIPLTYRYGKGAQPVILVPGTGDTGYTTFVGNYIPLLTGSSVGDPVWLNIPGYLLNDAQTNAEYVAYAINYIYGVSNKRKVAVFGWSQGNIDAQWAFKYWPSTRSKVTDHVAFSPDYHGTIIANFAAAPGEPLPPSLLQQEYNSNFIQTLRRNGGDSAYVPTTTVYSGLLDEVVEPQQGTGASAYLNDARRVGVSNNEVQLVCAGQAAGTLYTHEGILYNPLGYALAVDALSHAGPGQPSRLQLNSVCAPYLTPGLDLGDFLLTENTLLVAGISILAYPNKVTVEPPIKAYAA